MDQIILILRPIMVSGTNLDLIGQKISEDQYDDFEYDPNKLPWNDRELVSFVDGYEVNVFDQKITPKLHNNSDLSIPHTIFSNGLCVEKKFLSKSFIGDRKPGDVGILRRIYTGSGILTECFFSDDTMSDFFPIIYDFYKKIYINGNLYTTDIKYPLEKEGLQKMMDLLTNINRDIKINKIL